MQYRVPARSIDGHHNIADDGPSFDQVVSLRNGRKRQTGSNAVLQLVAMKEVTKDRVRTQPVGSAQVVHDEEPDQDVARNHRKNGQTELPRTTAVDHPHPVGTDHLHVDGGIRCDIDQLGLGR